MQDLTPNRFFIREIILRNEFQVSVVSEDVGRDVAVLRIASAASNTITQCYPERIQVSLDAIGDLDRKIHEKLRLHRIEAIHCAISIQFENDRTVSFRSLREVDQYDLKTDAITRVVTLKWSFVFDSEGNGDEHLHSIFVRISERPHPGLFLQRVLNSNSDDLDSLETDAFAPLSCKIDFFDSRFSSEILAVLTEWVKAQPKAEPTFGLIGWLTKRENTITSFIFSTLPVVIITGYLGLWLGVLSNQITGSVKISAAWILGGGVIFLFSRYIASSINRIISGNLQKISLIPVFVITSGDRNRITKYVAKSHNSMIKLCATGFLYGAFKAIGLYLASFVILAISK